MQCYISILSNFLILANFLKIKKKEAKDILLSV